MLSSKSTHLISRENIRRHADQTQLRQLLELPARWLADLPEPLTLHLSVSGAPAAVRFCTDARTESAPVLADHITFEQSELIALVRGAEADRIWHGEFLGMCFEKWRRPTFRVGMQEALCGANPDERVNWTVARWLTRLQVQIERIEWNALSGELPALHVAA
jgi:hypothetical protein